MAARSLARVSPAVPTLLVALLSSACSVAPPVRYYSLAPVASEAPAAGGRLLSAGGSPGGLRIGVEGFRVDPPYDQERIVYRVGSDPHRVGFYDYHRWSMPPERMLALATARRLEAEDGVALAEPAGGVGGSTRYDVLVRGRLLALEEVDRPGEERARVEIELAFFDPAGDELWRGRAEGSAAADVEEVSSVVALLEEALAEALRPAVTTGLDRISGRSREGPDGDP